VRVTIVSRIYAPETAAASTYLAAVAEAFAERGHDVTVMTVRPPSTLPFDDSAHRIRIRRARVLRDAHGYVRGYFPYLSFDLPLFFRLLFSRRADLYFVEPPPTTGMVVRVVSFLRRTPFVYRAADLWSDAAATVTSSALVLRLLRTVEVGVLRASKMSFAASPGLLARMREIGVSSPAMVAGSGADTEVYRYDPAVERTGKPYFIYAGTYSEWQGASVLVEGFADFIADHPEFRLVYIGSGSDRALLEERSRSLGLSTVEFLEPVPGPALNVLLNNAVASVASLRPGMGYDYAFPSKIFTSLAAGCPVIFAGVGPTVPFLRQAASNVTVGEAVDYDANEVSAAMRRIAETRASPVARRRLSEWARQHHSLAATCDKVVSACEAVLTPSRRGKAT